MVTNIEIDEVKKWYERSLKLLSLRPRSISEIRKYLSRKQVPDALILQIIDRLTSAKLLDDYAFAVWFVENRQEFRPKATPVLKFELIRKGINREIIEEVLLRKLGSTGESAGAYKVAEKKWRILKGYNLQEKKRKLQEFLWRKGYGRDIVRSILEKLQNK